LLEGGTEAPSAEIKDVLGPTLNSSGHVSGAAVTRTISGPYVVDPEI